MQTEILPVGDIDRDSDHIRRAATRLREGGLVVFPTETVYGLGANALDEHAVAGIFRAKGRPADNPLIVHICTLEEIAPLVTEFPPQAQRLATAFWPGPLTMILPKSSRIHAVTSGGLATVAIRMPSHPVARALIRKAGVPVAAPSANRSGSPSPTSAKHCIADLSGRVDMILDGGDCAVGVESTVLSLAGEIPLLLRPGAVTIADLRQVLGEVAVDEAVTHHLADGKPAASPGMKYQHYAPHAQVTLVHGGDEKFYRFAAENRGENIRFLAFEEDAAALGEDLIAYGAATDPAAQARRLFSALRELDEAGAQTVYARAPSSDGVGLAVYNRLLRAAAFREIYLA
jgi:L-threonylcarbamoyladenylate synthase